MGKPPSDDPRTEMVHLRLTKSERAEADERRGQMPLSEWFRRKAFGRRHG